LTVPSGLGFDQNGASCNKAGKENTMNNTAIKTKINPTFHKAYDMIYSYIDKNPDIKKAVVFGTALCIDEPMDLNEEMQIAIYLKNPTEDKIDSISRYINDNIADVWGCMIDDKKYDDCPILKQTISKGVIVYEKR
jgi:hypothetical protein